MIASKLVLCFVAIGAIARTTLGAGIYSSSALQRLRQRTNISGGNGLRERSRRIDAKRALKSGKRSSKSKSKEGSDDDDEETVCDNDDALFRTCGGKGKGRRSLSTSSIAQRETSLRKKRSNRALKMSSKGSDDEEGLFPPEIGSGANLEIGDITFNFFGVDVASVIEGDCDCRLDVERALITWLNMNFNTADQEFLCAAVVESTSAQGGDSSVTSLGVAVTFALDNDFEADVEAELECTAENLVLCCVQEAINGEAGGFCESRGCNTEFCSMPDYWRRLEDALNETEEEGFGAVLLRRCKNSDLASFLSCAVDECGDDVDFGLADGTEVVLGSDLEFLQELSFCLVFRDEASLDGCQDFITNDCEIFDLNFERTNEVCTFSDTSAPSNNPTAAPSVSPTFGPTAAPTNGPTAEPTEVPTAGPTVSPSSQPTDEPSPSPTSGPTSSPTEEPTFLPTFGPTDSPTFGPTSIPTSAPTSLPTDAPTNVPTVLSVSMSMSLVPFTPETVEPTMVPTSPPTTAPTSAPTSQPTAAPSSQPTFAPTSTPSSPPTFIPTSIPTSIPTDLPTAVPTFAETESMSLSMSLSMSASMSVPISIPLFSFPTEFSLVSLPPFSFFSLSLPLEESMNVEFSLPMETAAPTPAVTEFLATLSPTVAVDETMAPTEGEADSMAPTEGDTISPTGI